MFFESVSSAPRPLRANRSSGRFRWPLAISLAIHASILGAATLVLAHGGPSAPPIEDRSEIVTLRLDLRRQRSQPVALTPTRPERTPIPQARSLSALRMDPLDREIWASVPRALDDDLSPPPRPAPRELTVAEGAQRGRLRRARATSEPNTLAANVGDVVGVGDSSAVSDGPSDETGASALGEQADAVGSGAIGSSARAIVTTRPEYPTAARQRGEQGTVGCRIHVRADGSVESVEVLTSSGSRRLDRAAVSALECWRFEPALDQGEAIACVVDQEVRFALTS